MDKLTSASLAPAAVRSVGGDWLATLRGIRLSPAQAGLLALAAVFIFARLFNLTADFPPGFTISGALFTDEGWYANAATRFAHGAPWYQAGDFNPAVSMPAFQLVQAGVFTLFGPSLASARLVSVAAYVACALIAALLVRRSTDRTIALFVLLALAAHPAGFAFSRLAVVEPFAAVGALGGVALAIHANHRRAWLAGGLVALAILAKTSMIFAAPVMFMALMLTPRDGCNRLGAMIRAALALAPAAVWMVTARIVYPADTALFSDINLGDRFVQDVWQWIDNPSAQGSTIAHLFGAPLTLLCGVIIAAACALSPAFRATRRVWIWTAFIALYLVELRFLTYGPPRYFLPLLFPAAILTAEAAHALLRAARVERTGAILAAACLAILAPGAFRIASIIGSGDHSHITMLREVGHQIETGAIVVGKFADTLALEADVRAINWALHTRPDPADAMREIAPHYLIADSLDVEIMATLEAAGAGLVPLQDWNVFPAMPELNDTITLYRLDWPASPAPDVR